MRVYFECAVLTLLLSCASVARAGDAGLAMVASGRATLPLGHYEFCSNHPGECGPLDWTSPIVLTDGLMATIDAVNREVNHQVRSATDLELYGVEERWVYPTDAGDVEDAALLKRRKLAQEGIPLSDLLLVVALTNEGEGTAVLAVTTTGGDYILDQATDEVKLWRDVPYTFLKRQTHKHAGRWEKVQDERATATEPSPL